MFRSVLVIILVIVVLWLARTVMQRLKQTPQKPSISSKDTVQCLHCKTYIPRDEAITEGDKAFCSQQHLEEWNKTS